MLRKKTASEKTSVDFLGYLVGPEVQFLHFNASHLTQKQKLSKNFGIRVFLYNFSLLMLYIIQKVGQCTKTNVKLKNNRRH